jgi:DNA excision repair protein ERCC-2
MVKIYFRHDRFRLYQEQFVHDVYDAISHGNHMLINAPTGCGKTDAVLAPAITYAIENNLSIFFITPKISQHKIAIDVVKDIAKKFDLRIRAVDMIGRRYACIDPSLGELDQESFYHICEKKRKQETCEFYRNAKGFSKVEQARADALYEKLLAEYGNAKTHNEIIKLGERNFACPYELLLRLAAISDVIVADYYHIMIKQIREIFLLKTKKQLEKSIIIIDEAHNLAKRVREHLSSTITSHTLRRVEKEMKLIGLEPIDISHEFDRWAKEKLNNANEVLISKEMFDEFLSAYNMEKDEMRQYFDGIGLDFIERTNKKSACLKFSVFLKNWDGEEKGTIRILKRKENYFSLSKRFLDPSIATSILNEAHSTILMSGTLLPLEMHRDLLGLDEKRTIMKRYPSPFDEKNVINIIAEGTTTKYSKRTFENYSEIAKKIDAIVDASPGGVTVFFPSYAVLNAVVALMKSKNLIVQKEGMDPKETAELLRKFAHGGVLCGVQGGSLAEGVDFCNEEIKTIIIVGVALEEPNIETAALIDYYQEKFGKGWEYGYIYPAVIKALQAAGRGIRKETDRVAIVFMDERFKWKNYRKILGDGRRFIITSEPEKYVKKFWTLHKS